MHDVNADFLGVECQVWWTHAFGRSSLKAFEDENTKLLGEAVHVEAVLKDCRRKIVASGVRWEVFEIHSVSQRLAYRALTVDQSSIRYRSVLPRMPRQGWRYRLWQPSAANSAISVCMSCVKGRAHDEPQEAQATLTWSSSRCAGGAAANAAGRAHPFCATRADVSVGSI